MPHTEEEVRSNAPVEVVRRHPPVVVNPVEQLEGVRRPPRQAHGHRPVEVHHRRWVDDGEFVIERDQGIPVRLVKCCRLRMACGDRGLDGQPGR
jgi:hypothetical protein